MRGDFLRPPHGTTPSAVITNKNKKLRSFKSKENIRKAEDGPYLGFGYKSLNLSQKVKRTSSPKGNDRSPESHQVNSSNLLEKKWGHYLLHYKSMVVFCKGSRAANSVVCGSIWSKFEINVIIHFLLICKFKSIESIATEKKRC